MNNPSLQQSITGRFLIGTLMILMGLFFTACNDDSTGTNDEEVFFNSGQIEMDETYEYTFEQEGTVPYYCSNHEPDMTGQITVESNGENADQDTVRMEDHTFNPDRLTISVNTTVVWINDGEEAHTVTSGRPSGNSDGGGY